MVPDWPSDWLSDALECGSDALDSESDALESRPGVVCFTTLQTTAMSGACVEQ